MNETERYKNEAQFIDFFFVPVRSKCFSFCSLAKNDFHVGKMNSFIANNLL